ncbi:hypothetical protein [Caballeronia sp. KNU42]
MATMGMALAVIKQPTRPAAILTVIRSAILSGAVNLGAVSRHSV